MKTFIRVAYLTGCFLLPMVVLFSMVCAQDTCPTPGIPSNLSPSDGAANVSVNPILSWIASQNTDSYNVYFGTSSNPPYLGNTTNSNYSLADLASNTTYFWRVVALNNCGNFTAGPVWNFKTACQAPTIPSNPVPQNGAWVVPTPTPAESGVIFNVSLGWASSSYANSYDVYFGASSDPPFLGNSLTGNYYVSGLTLNTTYSWRVVALSDCGYSTSGPVWSFTTAPANPFSFTNWTEIEPPNISEDWSLNSVHFTSSNEGWAVGVDNQNNRGVLLHHLNGTWTSVPPLDFSPSWELNSVHFTSPDEGWAVGTENIPPISRGVLLHYLNGFWTNVTPPNLGSSWGLNSVYFTSSNEGWAVGSVDGETEKGALLHYINDSWEAIDAPDFPYSWGLKSVHFTSSNDGWAVGSGQSGGQIPYALFLHYFDGSWTLSHDSGSKINSVYLISPNESWAVGGWPGSLASCGGVTFLHYSNGSWKDASSIGSYPCWTLNSVYFTSANEGWAVGKLGMGIFPVALFQYWYGDWEVVTLPFPPYPFSASELNSVHFTSSNDGWAVGGDGRGILLHFSGEIISAPTTPRGPISGTTGTSYPYSSGGSTSSLGHSVEYQFDWGDATHSEWLPVGTTSALKSWSSVGTYSIKAKARCASDFVESDWSNPLNVTVSTIGPDLTGDWISLSPSCKNGKCKLSGTLKVENIGNRDASSTSVKIYLSANDTFSADDILLKVLSAGKAKAGGFKLKKVKANLPTNETASGKHIIAIIDEGNLVQEIDETNNVVPYGPIP